jgi:hypothetical protein
MFQKFHRQPQCTLQLASVDRVLFVSVDLNVSLCWQQYPKCKLEICLKCGFIHLAVCLTTGPKPLPKPSLHIVRSRASSFKWEYPQLSLKSSSSFLLLPRLPVTSIPPHPFNQITQINQLTRCINFSALLPVILNTGQQVSDVFTPIIRSSTAVAASGFSYCHKRYCFVNSQLYGK